MGELTSSSCTKTLSNCDFGAYFEREAGSPKLLSAGGIRRRLLGVMIAATYVPGSWHKAWPL